MRHRFVAVLAASALACLAAASASPAYEGAAGKAAPADPSPPLTPDERARVDAWLRDLDHREPSRRAEATAALRAFGPRALPGLRAAAASGSEERRARAGLLVQVLEAGADAPEEGDGSWITLKGDMGRTGSRGVAPSRGVAVRGSFAVGFNREHPLDAPLACADGVLVVAHGDRVTALRASDLRHLWEVGLGSPVLASPVVAAGRVFVGTSRGLTSLDLRDRKEMWTVSAAYGVGAAPLVCGNTLYACLGDEAVVALDPATGAQRWEHRCAAGSAAPVLAAGRVVLGTRTGEVLALDAATGKVAWTLPVDGRMAFSPATVGGSVVVGDGGRRLRCVDAASGTVLWTRSVEGRFAGDGPAASARAIVFSTTNMEVEAYEPATGARLWRRWVGTRHLSSPALAGDLVLFGARTRLVAVSARSGDDAWEIDLDGEVSCPLIAAGTAFALAGGRLVAVR